MFDFRDEDSSSDPLYLYKIQVISKYKLPHVFGAVELVAGNNEAEIERFIFAHNEIRQAIIQAESVISLCTTDAAKNEPKTRSLIENIKILKLLEAWLQPFVSISFVTLQVKQLGK